MHRIARFGVTGLALALLLGAGAALAATQVPSSISFAPSAGAPDKVQSGCQLQTLVPQAIQQAGGADVQLVDKPSKGARYLELTISEIHAPGGGFFSGPKWMAVSGKLYDHGKVIGSFRAKRVSGAAKSTCGTLQRVANAIGQDIAGWLKAPSMNAEIGDAR